MANAMMIELPATGGVGSDDDFDLRTTLERELNQALALEEAGECDRGEIEDGRMSIWLEAVTDPPRTLQIVKSVLTRLKLLHRAVVVLETRCDADPDDIDRQTLWPLHHPAARVA